MANLSGIEIKPRLRPCLVAGQGGTSRALFHCWSNKAYVVPPSLLKGGHTGGQVWTTYGIVEMEDGSVFEVLPSSIEFLDPPHEEYAWRPTPDSE